MGLLSERVSRARDEGRKSLVAYIVAGDPAREVTVPLMHELVAGGADVIELGVPFSDPEAEGPVIQLAHERALAGGTSLGDCLDMVRAFREQDAATPVVLMGYLNPVETMGFEPFSKRAAASGVNGAIIVNLPPEESAELGGHLRRNGVASVYLLAPTTTDERARMICEAGGGFVYYVSLKGTTGADTLDAADVADKLARFRKFSELPIMVGFGVKDSAGAKAVAAHADGVVVGSAIVEIMAGNLADPAALKREVRHFVAELRAAID